MAGFDALRLTRCPLIIYGDRVGSGWAARWRYHGGMPRPLLMLIAAVLALVAGTRTGRAQCTT
jgi:hypothetical protein